MSVFLAAFHEIDALRADLHAVDGRFDRERIRQPLQREQLVGECPIERIFGGFFDNESSLRRRRALEEKHPDVLAERGRSGICRRLEFRHKGRDLADWNCRRKFDVDQANI